MPEHPSHPLSVAEGSRLAAAIGTSTRVNSYHHQAVARLGEGLDAVAWADDGIVEAIALAGDERVLGVQWELQVSWQEDRRFLELFTALVRDAARFSAGARAGSRHAA